MSGTLRILVVDDERLSRVTTVRQLVEAGYEAEAVENAFKATDMLESGNWDVVITDLRMPAMDGLEFLTKLKEENPEIDVILITAYGSVETAVEAMHKGAADYLSKPFAFAELDMRLKRLAELRTARQEVNTLRALLDGGCGHCGHCGMVGHSAVMAKVCERAQAFADNQAPVLITGETGTGKEVVSRALHSLSSRAKGPFVAVGCGTIPRELAESELFGHEKGAFTSAASQRIGSFERADGGTLLLDDVDDLPLDVQVKLLRVLQEGTLTRVGGSKEITVDVRLVATSKVDLEQSVKEKIFRDDLFYRLRGLEIRMPPLRERGDDVLLLAQHFLKQLASAQGESPKTLSADSANSLRRYSWPGNVRELRRAIETAVILAPMNEIQVENLPEYVRGENASKLLSEFELHLEGRDDVNFKVLSKEFEEALIQWALKKAEGQQKRAADLLGIPRTTLQSKIQGK